MRELKIGSSGVRGIVGAGLTPELIVDFACAFGTWAGGDPVVIGRDARRSSVLLRAAVLSGLMSPGSEVIDLGLAPTPLISFAVRELGAAGGISITGSHNDDRWNALKFLGPDGALLDAVKSGELLDIWHASSYRTAPRDRLGPLSEAPGIEERYLELVLSALDVPAVRERGFRVAVDFCNGSVYPTMARFLSELGCELVALNERPASRFAHLPSPTPDHLRSLAHLVDERGADLGAGVNIDGDRLGLVAEDGSALSEECTLPLAAECRFARRPGPVVTNLSTSGRIDAVARRHGQRVVRTKVGENHVIARGLEEEAVIAGEGSGGVAILPYAVTFDATLALGTILESLARRDATLSSLAAALPARVIRKGEIPCEPHRVYRALEGFRRSFAERAPDLRDGVRVEWDDAWLHVRASGTEPLLRVIVEAESETRAETIWTDAMAQGRRATERER